MDALRDVSREVIPGNLRVAYDNGLLKGENNLNRFKKENLEIAYDIFQDLIECDLDQKTITMDILKLAKDPNSSLENVVERMQALDLE